MWVGHSDIRKGCPPVNNKIQNRHRSARVVECGACIPILCGGSDVAAEGKVMAKRKPKPKDSHLSGFMVRIPEQFRPVLKALQIKHSRPMTLEVQLAIIQYAKASGVPCPETPHVNGRNPG